MEGQVKPTNKLKFIESKRKLRVGNQINFPHQKLIAAANNHDLTIVGAEDNSIKCIQTSKLLDFNSNQAQIINEAPTNLISLSFRPTLLTVARHGYSSVLLIIGTSSFPNCPNIEAYDLDSRSTIGKLSLAELGGAEIVDYAWHPNYFETLVALCSSRGHLLVLAINRQDKGIGIVYTNDQYGALTCCWSPKGKNLAVGTAAGRIFRLEPIVGDNSFSFKEVDRSTLTFTNPRVTSEHQVVKLRWINKNYLLAAHAKANSPTGPETVYSLLTVKPSKPYLYWGNMAFENQSFSNYGVHMANLTNCVVCATSAAGEAVAIGVLGANEAATNEMNDWGTLIVEEEGARIELPLDANNTETHPCGVTTTTWPQDSRPILIFYTNDGLICPYAAMHSDNILKLPEFQPAQTFKFDVPKAAPQSSIGSAFGGKAAFYQTPVFGGAATFQTQTFGSLASGQTSAFGSSSLQQASTFGSLSLSQSTTPTTSTFGGAASFFKPTSLTAQSPLQMGAQSPSQISAQSPPQISAQSPPQISAQSTPQIGAQSPLGNQSLFGTSFQSSLPTQSSIPSTPQTLFQSPSQTLNQTPSQTEIKSSPLFTTLSSSLTLPTSQPQLTPLQTTTQSPINLTLQSTPQQLSQTQIPPRPKTPPQHTVRQDTRTPLKPTSALNILKPLESQQARQTQEQEVPKTVIQSTFDASFGDKIQQVREKLNFNEAYISLFDELNNLRDRFEEALDLHETHQEALGAVRDETAKLDLEVLETYYLLEYVQGRGKCDVKKKSIDPVTVKKVNNIKLKLKNIEKKLEELNNHVDVAWEDFVRRKSNKDRRVSSLDIIYKTLATNQKIINALKKKVEIEPEKSINTTSSVAPPTMKPRDEDHSKFEEFLASRSVVPVRKPIH